MSFVILEGLDRTGKSTVAQYYKNKGYEVVHVSAPDKKYSTLGYVGPSYLDDCMDIYMKYNGRNVCFDRSFAYGELVWPSIYGRLAMIDEEGREVLQEIEERNNAEYILMHDPNVEAHWRRCVDNKEPLTRDQFNKANLAYKILLNFGFKYKTLREFTDVNKIAATEIPKETLLKAEAVSTSTESLSSVTPEQARLEKANAINRILSVPRIIKPKGDFYDIIENDIRSFLNMKIKQVLDGNDINKRLTDEELSAVKMLAQQLVAKAKNGGK